MKDKAKVLEGGTSRDGEDLTVDMLDIRPPRKA